MIKEFKEFISKGNVVDLAVGVIIGGAFGKIVTSLVNDIIMPLIGVIIGGIDFSNITIKVKESTINIGLFIQNIVDFLIIAFCIFLFVKFVNKLSKLKKKEEEKKEEPKPEVSEEVKLLREINKNIKELKR